MAHQFSMVLSAPTRHLPQRDRAPRPDQLPLPQFSCQGGVGPAVSSQWNPRRRSSSLEPPTTRISTRTPTPTRAGHRPLPTPPSCHSQQPSSFHNYPTSDAQNDPLRTEGYVSLSAARAPPLQQTVSRKYSLEPAQKYGGSDSQPYRRARSASPSALSNNRAPSLLLGSKTYGTGRQGAVDGIGVRFNDHDFIREISPRDSASSMEWFRTKSGAWRQRDYVLMQDRSPKEGTDQVNNNFSLFGAVVPYPQAIPNYPVKPNQGILKSRQDMTAYEDASSGQRMTHWSTRAPVREDVGDLWQGGQQIRRINPTRHRASVMEGDGLIHHDDPTRPDSSPRTGHRQEGHLHRIPQAPRVNPDWVNQERSRSVPAQRPKPSVVDDRPPQRRRMGHFMNADGAVPQTVALPPPFPPSYRNSAFSNEPVLIDRQLRMGSPAYERARQEQIRMR